MVERQGIIVYLQHLKQAKSFQNMVTSIIYHVR